MKALETGRAQVQEEASDGLGRPEGGALQLEIWKHVEWWVEANQYNMIRNRDENSVQETTVQNRQPGGG